MSALIVDGRRFDSSDPILFTLAYRAGKRAAGTSEDTDALLRYFLAEEDYAAAAGYLEGLAAGAREHLPEHPVDCPCQRCVFDRRDLMRHIRRLWREQVSA